MASQGIEYIGWMLTLDWMINSVYVSDLFRFASRCSLVELSNEIAVCAAQFGFSMCEGPWKTYTYSIE